MKHLIAIALLALAPIVTAQTRGLQATPSGSTGTVIWPPAAGNLIFPSTLQLNGSTSGALKFAPAAATAQTVTIATAAQTTGATTLTIPDQAGTSRAFVFDTLSQALTNKTVNGLTITSSTGTLTIANGKTFTASNTLTLTGTDGSTLNVGTGGTLGTGAYITLGANVGTFLTTPTGANLAAALSTPLPASGGGTGITSLGSGITTILGKLISEDVVSWRDDFIGGTNTDGQIGERGWRLNAIAGSTAASAYQLGVEGHPGIYRIQTGATSGNGVQLTATGSSLVTIYAFTAATGEYVCTFRLNTTSSVVFRAGLGNGTTSEPTRWMGIRFSTVAGDSNFQAVAYNNDGSESGVDTGTAVDTNWHTLRIRRISTTAIGITFDGGAELTSGVLASEVPNSQYTGPFIHVTTQTTAAASADMDYAGLVMEVTR